MLQHRFHRSTCRAKRMLLTVPLAIASILTAASLASADNWPQWRGAAGDSISRETGLPIQWSETAGLAWKVEIPEYGTSTPCIWDDSIFLTTQYDEELLLLKLRKADGSVEWTRTVGAAETPREAEKRSVQKFHRLHNNASPSAVTDGQTVVVHFGNGDLAAYDFAGKELWKRNLQVDYGTYTIWWGHANSPVIYGDLVISVCMQDSLAGVSETLTASYVVAHDLHTGEVRWNTPRMTAATAEECDAYTTPVFHTAGETTEMVIMGANQVDAYDPATGRQLWHLPGLVGGRTITGPTLAHGLVYATRGMRGDLLAVRLGGSGQLPDDAISWKQNGNTPDSCSPVVWGELVFTVSDDGIAKCYDALSGEERWKARLPGGYKASPLAAEGRIYFLNMEGVCTVAAADGERFEKLAENRLGGDAGDKVETIASPAVSDGRIYLRTRKHLYAIGAR